MGKNSDEGLQKHTRTYLDLLEWSQLPGHHCLKCVFECIISVFLCVRVCVCVSLVYLNASAYINASQVFEAK